MNSEYATRNRNAWRRFAAVFAIWLLTTLAGLGGGENATGTVEGRVGVDGHAIPSAVQLMFLDRGTGVSGVADVEGRTFSLDEPLSAGVYQVFLTPRYGTALIGDPVPVKTDLGVPAVYTNEATTPLRATVDEGGNAFDIDLAAGTVTRAGD